MRTIDLAGSGWKLRPEFLDVGPERVEEVLRRPEGELVINTKTHSYFPEDIHPYPHRVGWIPATLPCDVHTPLMEAGLIGEVLEGENTKLYQWIDQLSWWFVRSFDVDEAMLACDEVRLYLEWLDFKADIFINEVPVGHHENSFVPFEKDVKEYLRPGENRLTVRLTSGYEDRAHMDTVTWYATSGFASKDHRSYLRKPQYTHGWDWCPPVPTCGMGRRMELVGFEGAYIRHFRADTLSLTENGREAEVELYFEIDKADAAAADEGVFSYRLSISGEVVYAAEEELYLAGGLNFIRRRIKLEDPKLWWPGGYGPQNLYTLEAELECRGARSEFKDTHVGIRFLRLDQTKISEVERRFRFEVNHVPVFCKGGNWVPCDSVYLRITPEKYHHQLQEAALQHFTMLRVWGGGLYEPDCFYRYCSELGILIMQDFMYSCAYYPDHLDWFVNEARKEAYFQVKRLAHFPCMAVFTGNNEIAESWTDWWPAEEQTPYRYGQTIFNYVQPEAVDHCAPQIPYMPSTPYFGHLSPAVAAGQVKYMSPTPQWGKNANNPLTGDIHAWTYFGRDADTRGAFGVELEATDRLPARFSSEYGYFGTMKEGSMRRAMGLAPEEPLDWSDPRYIHHGDRLQKRGSILNTVNTHVTDTAAADRALYERYGAVAQGLVYSEMAESMRAKPYGAGDLIWMYDDCWPETGWSTVDYFGVRKDSFYLLRRAFAPRKMILRREGAEDYEQYRSVERQTGDLILILINESEKPCKTRLTLGYVSFDGQRRSALGAAAVLRTHTGKYASLEAWGEVRIEADGTLYMEGHSRAVYVVDEAAVLAPCGAETENVTAQSRYGLPVRGTIYAMASDPEMETAVALRGYLRVCAFEPAKLRIVGDELVMAEDVTEESALSASALTRLDGSAAAVNPFGGVVPAESAPASYYRRITLRAENYIPVVRLSADNERIHYSDNFFRMLPGEERTILVEGRAEGFTAEALEIKPGDPPEPIRRG